MLAAASMWCDFVQISPFCVRRFSQPFQREKNLISTKNVAANWLQHWLNFVHALNFHNFILVRTHTHTQADSHIHPKNRVIYAYICFPCINTKDDLPHNELQIRSMCNEHCAQP